MSILKNLLLATVLVVALLVHFNVLTARIDVGAFKDSSSVSCTHQNTATAALNP